MSLSLWRNESGSISFSATQWLSVGDASEITLALTAASDGIGCQIFGDYGGLVQGVNSSNQLELLEEIYFRANQVYVVKFTPPRIPPALKLTRIGASGNITVTMVLR